MITFSFRQFFSFSLPRKKHCFLFSLLLFCLVGAYAEESRVKKYTRTTTNILEQVFVRTNLDIAPLITSNSKTHFNYETNLTKTVFFIVTNFQETNFNVIKTNFYAITNLSIASNLVVRTNLLIVKTNITIKTVGDFLGGNLYNFNSDRDTNQGNLTNITLDSNVVYKSFFKIRTNFTLETNTLTSTNITYQKLSSNKAIFEIITNTETYWQTQIKQVTNFQSVTNLAFYFYINTETTNVETVIQLVTQNLMVTTISNASRKMGTINQESPVASTAPLPDHSSNVPWYLVLICLGVIGIETYFLLRKNGNV
jgi:hypothetical protein